MLPSVVCYFVLVAVDEIKFILTLTLVSFVQYSWYSVVQRGSATQSVLLCRVIPG